MQRPQTETPLPKGPTPSSGEGLAASIEAASKAKGAQPTGKGVAMVVLAVLVVLAVGYEMFFSTSTPPPTKEAPTVPDRKFDLPGDLSAGLGGQLALALTEAAGSDAKKRRASLETLRTAFEEVPADLREPTRARLLAHLATIGTDNKKARADVLQTATKLVETLPEDQASASRRMNLVAELALDDDGAASAALVYLSYLPAPLVPVDAITAVVLDASRKLAIRVAAAHALPADLRPDAVKKLADDESTPRVLRQALR